MHATPSTDHHELWVPSRRGCDDEKVLGTKHPDGSASFHIPLNVLRPGTSQAVLRRRGLPADQNAARVSVARSPSFIEVGAEPWPPPEDYSFWPELGSVRWRVTPACHSDFLTGGVIRPSKGNEIVIRLRADALRTAVATWGEVQLRPLQQQCPDVATAMIYRADPLAVIVGAHALPSLPTSPLSRTGSFFAIEDTIELQWVAGMRSTMELQVKLNAEAVNAALLGALDPNGRPSWTEPDSQLDRSATLILHRPGEGFEHDALFAARSGFQVKSALSAAIRALPMDSLLSGVAVRQASSIAIVQYTRVRVFPCPASMPKARNGETRSAVVEVRETATGRMIAKRKFPAGEPSCDDEPIRVMDPDAESTAPKGWPDFERIRAFIERASRRRLAH